MLARSLVNAVLEQFWDSCGGLIRHDGFGCQSDMSCTKEPLVLFETGLQISSSGTSCTV